MYTRIKNWVQRNRYPLAIGAGLVGATYLTGQYLLGKLTEARQHMTDDRIARDNLRRRFAQNQEDCTYTVLALLPTATENIATALPVEDITAELQARRSERSARSVTSSELAPSDSPSTSGGHSGEGTESATGETSSFIHASRIAGETADNGTPIVSSGRSKTSLWNDIKIYSLTRAITLIYTLSLLTLLTRIQLNLLGRRNYLSSVISLASPPSPTTSNKIDLENHDNPLSQDYGSDFDTNRMYLTFSWWLLHRGWQDIRARVEAAVRNVFADVGVRETIMFGNLAERILEVRKQVEGASEQERRETRWLPFVMPETTDEERVLRESGISTSSDSSDDQQYKITPSLRRLLDETSDIIDSPTFSHVLTLALDASFSLLVDEKVADQAFKIPRFARHSPASRPGTLPSDELLGGASLGSRVEEVDESDDTPPMTTSERAKQTSCKLATILAVITRQAHAIGSGGDLGSLMASSNLEIPDMTASQGASLKDANEYLATIDAVRDLEAFAAVVYSSNFELDEVERDETRKGEEQVRSEASPAGVEVEQSLVDVGRDVGSSLESAWDKAVEKAQAAS